MDNVSGTKRLTLRDALLSGKRYKRKRWSYFFDKPSLTNSKYMWFTSEDVLADDYVLENKEEIYVETCVTMDGRVLYEKVRG